MVDAPHARAFGRVFDEVADAYDHHRPAYPDALVHVACSSAGLAPGAEVLEIGCGTGQLTRSLLARGLRVTALEPGRRLIELARERLGPGHTGAGGGADGDPDPGAAPDEVRFLNSRLEDAALPAAHYRATFSASAIHWVDPAVGWRMIADALCDGGTLALISYFGMDDPHSREDQHALRAALQRVAPELADEWPPYRNLEQMLEGAAERQDNVSNLWGWLGSYDIGRDHVTELFGKAELAVVPIPLEHTADELNALLGTMSFWARMSDAQRDALMAENRALHERLGRPIRSNTLACLVTARRRPRASAAPNRTAQHQLGHGLDR